MRVIAPVTDYIRRSLISTVGDLVVRGASAPEALNADTDGKILSAKGAATKPAWTDFFNLSGAAQQIFKSVSGGFYFMPLGSGHEYLKVNAGGTAVDYEPLHLDHTGITIGNSNRSTAGAQIISGIGFQSSLIIFGAASQDNPDYNGSIGVYSGGTDMCIWLSAERTKMEISASLSIYCRKDVTNRLSAYVSANGTNSFTLTWSLAGTLTVYFWYCCIP